MNCGFLNRLYWACVDGETQLEDGLNLGELYERTDSAAAAYEHFSGAVSGLTLTNEEKDLLGGLRFKVCTACEQQGFINGFRLGVKLAREIGEETAMT